MESNQKTAEAEHKKIKCVHHVKKITSLFPAVVKLTPREIQARREKAEKQRMEKKTSGKKRPRLSTNIRAQADRDRKKVKRLKAKGIEYKPHVDAPSLIKPAAALSSQPVKSAVPKAVVICAEYKHDDKTTNKPPEVFESYCPGTPAPSAPSGVNNNAGPLVGMAFLQRRHGVSPQVDPHTDDLEQVIEIGVGDSPPSPTSGQGGRKRGRFRYRQDDD